MKLKYRNEKNAKIISSIYNKPLDKPDWFRIENSTDDEADVLLYDYIGWPFNDEREFVQMIAGLKQNKITIRINSPGGDVFSANAIFNAIKAHPSKPTTRIESLAASAASYIAMAGHKKEAYKNTMMMIHEPLVGLFGNQYELREAADILDQISGNMIEMYADNTNVGKRELKDMLKAETWMNAKTMKEKGFIDTIIEFGKGAKAEYDLSIFNTIPEELKEGQEPTEREIEKALRDVGVPQNKAKAILAGCKKLEVVKQEVVEDKIDLTELKAALENLKTKII